MSNIPSITSKELIKIIEAKGFILDRIKGSHHIFYHFETRKRVVVPLHKKDLPIGTLMEILRQAGITRKEVIKFIHKE